MRELEWLLHCTPGPKWVFNRIIKRRYNWYTQFVIAVSLTIPEFVEAQAGVKRD